MKFSEMKYERPDLDKVLAQCEEYAKKMAAAQSRAAKNWYSFTAKKTP